MVVPDTRHSLLMRLTDASDVSAWDEFVAIYEPLVYRLARRKGLQDADAQEVVQEVMRSSRGVGDLFHRPGPGLTSAGQFGPGRRREESN